MVVPVNGFEFVTPKGKIGSQEHLACGNGLAVGVSGVFACAVVVPPCNAVTIGTPEGVRCYGVVFEVKR